MAEYVGSELQVAVQKRLRTRQAWISQTPELANGGRTLNFLAPEETGWARVLELTKEDNLAAFTAVPLEKTQQHLQELLGPDWKIPFWNVFFGDAVEVGTASKAVIEATPLPLGWRVENLFSPTDQQIDEIQSLNMATGVAPYPAYYSRGSVIPCLTTCIRDQRGDLAASASANDRYHPNSRFARHVFAGSVSVQPKYRGKGLGKLANALVLVESQKRFEWTTALEQARPDNTPSRRMIEACGLTKAQDLVTLGAIKSDEEFTR